RSRIEGTILISILQEVDDLGQLLFHFIHPDDISEGYLFIFLVCSCEFADVHTKWHHPTQSSFPRPELHKQDKDTEYDKKRQYISEYSPKERLLRILDIDNRRSRQRDAHITE
ncbi:hypothetical protein KAZ93_01960, partial [Patescibacteria group bacterium]|nr:hypothetical protein [Patescibacteria group bacterium]